LSSEDHHYPPPAQRNWILGACSATMFMAAVESTIVATAMPTIVGSLGGFDLFSWVFAVYLLAQAVTTPIYGRLADLYGRKRILMGAAGAFLVGTILCSFARTMPELIAFRALQGLGAGALTPVAYTIVGDIYPPSERARIQGYLNIIWGAAAVGGPVLGAFLTAYLGWPSVFWVNLPVGAAALAILAVWYHEEARRVRSSADYLGSLLLIIGFGSLMMALIQAEHLSGRMIQVLLATAAGALVLLVHVERRAANPALPVELWRNRVVAASSLGSLAIGAVMMTTPVFVPIYVQGLMGGSPLIAGFTLTSQSFAWTFTGALSGWAAARRSYREIALWGGVLFVAGAIFFVTLSPARGPLWAAAGGSLIGLGMGFSHTIYLVAAQGSVDRSRRGIATSGIVFMRMAGQTLGTAVLGGILNLSLPAGMARGDIERLMQPALRLSASSSELAQLSASVAGALANVFLATLAFTILALALAVALPAGHGTRSELAD
jgi:EmrB/QacA subfamily drug resistance transporter